MILPRRLRLTLSLCLAGSFTAGAAVPYLVKDIDPGVTNAGSDPVVIQDAGDLAYFVAKDALNGWQLRKTDGSPGGASMIYLPAGVPENLTATQIACVGTTVFFAGGTATDRELWKADGTVQGTALVKDIYPGSSGSNPQQMTPFGGKLYFVANSGSSAGAELWVSDGTAAGTSQVKDINPGENSSSPRELTVMGGNLYFIANNGSQGSEIWKTDGTAVGTTLLKDIMPGNGFSELSMLRATADRLFFFASDGVNGPELWISDGTTAGTQMVKDLRPGSSGVGSDSMAVMGNVAYFQADAGGIPGVGSELWKSDGTAAGTTLVKDIAAGTSASAPRFLAASGGHLLFTATTAAAGREVWSTDGTAAGTVMLAEARAGSAGVDVLDFKVSGGLCYYVVGDNTGTELWSSDGTVAGTRYLARVQGAQSSVGPAKLTAFQGKVLFVADDGIHGNEIWQSDGTVAGTRLLHDVDFAAAGGLMDGTSFASADGILYFTGIDAAHGAELWRTDGTADGTWMVKDINPGAVGATPGDLTAVGNQIFFTATLPATGAELWRTDGTEAGTVMVKDIYPGTVSSLPVFLTSAPAGDVLYFGARDAVNGHELWKSDGTAAGTTMVKNINPGLGQSLLSSPIFTGNQFYFRGSGAAGVELWRSDGSAAGTAMVKDLWTGPGSAPGDAKILALTKSGDGSVYFFAQNSIGDNKHLNGIELWRSDGTSEGTYLVKDIVPGDQGSAGPGHEMAALGSTILFVAKDSHGKELWRTDGSNAGTTLVADLSASDTAYGPKDFRTLNGRLYFTLENSNSTSELWTSDGSAAGTHAVRSFLEGGPNAPAYLTTTPERLYFTSYVPGNSPLWRSNGSFADTVPLPDQFAAFNAVSITNIVAVPGRLYLSVKTAEYGLELWALDLKTEPVLEQPEGTPLPASGGQVLWDLSGPEENTKTFTIRNRGELDLNGLQVVPDASAAGIFSVSTALMASSLAPDGTTSFTVTRTGPGIGSR